MFEKCINCFKYFICGKYSLNNYITNKKNSRKIIQKTNNSNFNSYKETFNFWPPKDFEISFQVENTCIWK